MPPLLQWRLWGHPQDVRRSSQPVAAVATTTNASTLADSRDRLLEGLNDMLLMLTEQLETRDEEEGSA